MSADRHRSHKKRRRSSPEAERERNEKRHRSEHEDREYNVYKQRHSSPDTEYWRKDRYHHGDRTSETERAHGSRDGDSRTSETERTHGSRDGDSGCSSSASRLDRDNMERYGTSDYTHSGRSVRESNTERVDTYTQHGREVEADDRGTIDRDRDGGEFKFSRHKYSLCKIFFRENEYIQRLSMMALSNAEKQRNYRRRRDQDSKRRAYYLEKSKQKYQTDKAVGKIITAANVKSERQRRQIRKEWRLKSRQYREKLKQSKTQNDHNTHNVETSITENEAEHNRNTEHISLSDAGSPSRQNPNVGLHEENENASIESHQKQSAKKTHERKRSKCVRKNMVLQSDIKRLEKKAEMYRKRWMRTKDNITNDKEDCNATPRTKTKTLLRMISKPTSRKAVKKCLLFHNVLVAALRKEYKEGKGKAKETVCSVVAGDILKKYRMISHTRQELGAASHHGNRVKLFSLTHRLDRKIIEFFERDDVSRLTSGIKETVTRFKVKQQKRVLMNDMKTLHQQFLRENTGISISYVSFARRRPFWVVPPTAKDRDTCACKVHENMMFMIQSLHSKNILPSANPQEIIAGSVCDMKEQDCMYSSCKKCEDKNVVLDYNPNEEIVWKEWRSKTEKRQVKNEQKSIVITVKEETRGTIGELVTQFKTTMVDFKRHTFNIHNQQNHYNHLRRNLKENEVLLHIDFAENYTCQLSTEIHSMHFGASKRQISLHTGVYVVQGKDAIPFCTVSDSLQHDPAGIWAFLCPVLEDIRSQHCNIDTIHIFSDEPATQYRQKNNFFLFSTELQRKGYRLSTWNFHESGHGKGAPDGVGAALKRAANTSVLHGKDITNAEDFINAIKAKSSVLLYEVKPGEVQRMSRKIPTSLQVVPGTMKLHQVMSSAMGSISYRNISCTCIEGNIHPGHELKTFTLKTYANQTNQTRLTDRLVKKEQHTAAKDDVQKSCSNDSHELETNVENSHKKQPTQNRTTSNGLKVQNEDSTDMNGYERTAFYQECISTLQKCKTFKSLKEECYTINTKQSKYSVSQQPISADRMRLPVDENALTLFPTDMDDTLYPVSVTADGDCLPYSGSVLAFGNEEKSVEIRVRIIVEQALFDNLYLSESHLQKGSMCTQQDNLAKTFAMFSDEYTPGVQLDEANIRMIYENEVMKIVRLKTYMGIWQLFALSSILQRPLISVYPQLGNPNVRKALHRKIGPRETKEFATDVSVMWTTTRTDMVYGHWVPNHFIPLLPVPECRNERDESFIESEPTPDENEHSPEEITSPFYAALNELDGTVWTQSNNDINQTLEDLLLTEENGGSVNGNELNEQTETTNKVCNSEFPGQVTEALTAMQNTYMDVHMNNVSNEQENDMIESMESMHAASEDKTKMENKCIDIADMSSITPKPSLEETTPIYMGTDACSILRQQVLAKRSGMTYKYEQVCAVNTSSNHCSENETVIIVTVDDQTYQRNVAEVHAINYADESDTIDENGMQTTTPTDALDSECGYLDNEARAPHGSGIQDKETSATVTEVYSNDFIMDELEIDIEENDIKQTRSVSEEELDNLRNQVMKKRNGPMPDQRFNNGVEQPIKEPEKMDGTYLDETVEMNGCSINDLLKEYVVVRYAGDYFPGLVTDVNIDKNEVLVRCMHPIRKQSNQYKWPVRKDEIWYHILDVVSVMPEPLKIGRCYHVDNAMFQNVC